jgi:hypothetical protein
MVCQLPDPQFPCWLEDETLKRLVTVRISNVEFVPNLRWLVRLKDLYIEKIKVTNLFSFVGYHSLEILTITEMPNLRKFIQENDIPTLQMLEVSSCPELREVVIHRNLHHDKFKARHCSKLSPVVCVPQD